jgi:hypothetical protein
MILRDIGGNTLRVLPCLSRNAGKLRGWDCGQRLVDRGCQRASAPAWAGRRSGCCWRAPESESPASTPIEQARRGPHGRTGLSLFSGYARERNDCKGNRRGTHAEVTVRRSWGADLSGPTEGVILRARIQSSRASQRVSDRNQPSRTHDSVRKPKPRRTRPHTGFCYRL